MTSTRRRCWSSLSSSSSASKTDYSPTRAPP
jgi:hypothetical protein